MIFLKESERRILANMAREDLKRLYESQKKSEKRRFKKENAKDRTRDLAFFMWE